MSTESFIEEQSRINWLRRSLLVLLRSFLLGKLWATMFNSSDRILFLVSAVALQELGHWLALPESGTCDSPSVICKVSIALVVTC